MSVLAKPGTARQGLRITPDEAKMIVTLKAEGLSNSEISRRLHRSREAIIAVLRGPAAEDLRLRARVVLENALERFAEDWVRASDVGSHKGRHEPALDALERLGVVEPVQPSRTGSVDVQIGVNLPLPGLPATGCECGAPVLIGGCLNVEEGRSDD